MKSYIKRYRYIELVKATLSIFGQSFWTMMGLVVLFWAPGLVLRGIFHNSSPIDPVMWGVILPVELILSALGPVAAVGEISRICQGERPSIGRALSRISIRVAWGFFYTGILMAVTIIFWFCIGLFLSGLVKKELGSDVVYVVALIIAMIPAAFFIVRYVFTSQIVVLERLYWGRALKRSAVLVSWSFWRVAVYTAIGPAILFLARFFFGYAWGVLLKGWTGPSGAGPLSGGWAVVGQLIALLIWPLSFIFVTLLYYDLRIQEQASNSEAEPEPEIPPTVLGPGYSLDQPSGS